MSGIGIALVTEGGVVSLLIVAAFVGAIVLRKRDYTFSFTLLSARVSPPSPAARAKAAAAESPGAAGNAAPVPISDRRPA